MGILLGKAIYYILSGSTEIHNYVGDKIYPIFAEDETLNPFIVYERKSLNAFYTKDGNVYDEVIISISVVSDNYTESINISQAVRTALELKTGMYNGVNIFNILLSNVNESFGMDGYITTLEFTIKCK